ncbi:MAG: Glycosyl transferase group 1 [Parcubacteria group bacterium GW2011_GWC1_42_11]|uniref:Glycosyl transferase group 1 n=1 Tax=Candidatus Nomurabacteria bacterium GW2011_GWC2_42_20 TaxID=1618756 RepID=A0A0G0ZGT8_9BACT|nr:MAG: Glycosyl transferase group 1 [Parcubacteria group bacterium GW2011_GWC1_42_11]KKS47927.1 MAG: Glycosyl transferase group 1 [Candidatus Nomurabacteria bacterium GW2011_GWC2_42_20]KKS59089.1 MAG: Glycosyl transferase group 1 [Candidatus Nomurabacteria bacterium GW2011_GWA2_42_41]KKT09694.1 MAG: Glycosyl transferase group 1 [Candidatus Nomurabacteria bacterium GW2011_GWB1_43_20]
MKILHTVKYYSPICGGMYEVVRQISEKLIEQGHTVTVASLPVPRENGADFPTSSVHVEEFDIKGGYTTELTGEVAEYQRFVLNSDFDIVTNFAAQQPMTDALLPVLPEVTAKKVFVPTGFSGLYLKVWYEYFSYMPDWMRQYDMNVIISEGQRDMQFAKDHQIENYTIISNGSSREEMEQPISFSIRKRLSIPDENLLILHVGTHTGYKGHSRAIKIFAQAKTGPATLLIVGGEYPAGCSSQCDELAKKYNDSVLFKNTKKNIVVKHITRAETIAAYRESDIFLFPSNIEGGASIVLFESMASSLPFLATDVGSVRDIIREGHGGMLLPTDKNVPPEDTIRDNIKHWIKTVLEFFNIKNFHSDRGFVRAKIRGSAKLLEKLCTDKKLREDLGKAGHEAWLEKFTWEKIAGQYENLYKQLLEEK